MSVAIAPARLISPSDGRRPRMWRTILSTPEGRIGVPLGAVMILVIAVGRFAAPYAPDKIGVAIPGSAPSREHLLGADGLGRDVLSRFLTGGTSVLVTPLGAVSVSFLIGGALGLLAAYQGGGTDQVISRVFDLLLTIPPLLTVLVLLASLRRSPLVIVLVVGLVFIPWVGRVARGAAQPVVTNDYVHAAVARGESTWWILRREVLPNIAAPMIGVFSLYLTSGIVFVSTLSFLGLGDQPPSSSWGLMVAESRGFIVTNPVATLAPALGIAAVSVSFMLISDAVTPT
ncbi:MAG: ABC transporter permease [Pseudonocardiaceae bacterium]